MTLPTSHEAEELLFEHVKDKYQRYHALMVATAMEGYAGIYASEGKYDENLWWATGYLHDIDFEEHPDEHPGPSLKWFKEW